MDSNKLQEFMMKDSKLSQSRKNLKNAKLIEPYFSKRKVKILYLFECMWMILSLKSSNKRMCKKYAKVMMNMMVELNSFLGLLVKQTKSSTFIFQEKYAKELVKKFGMENFKNTETPMLIRTKKSKFVDLKLYRSMIGFLLYLTPCRQDI